MRRFRPSRAPIDRKDLAGCTRQTNRLRKPHIVLGRFWVALRFVKFRHVAIGGLKMTFAKLLNSKLVFLALGIALLFPLMASAQSSTGTISGAVTDPNGGVLPGASVTLINEQNGASRNAVTNDEGRFSFASVQPGIYTVKIEKQGFQTLQRTNNSLTASDNLALGELALTAGSVSETVTVTSEGQTIEKDSSNLTARLTADQLDLISTKGRDVTSLLRLLPGTSNNDDVESVGEGFGTDLPNISGQRGRSTVTSIDGLNASEPSGSNKVSMTINQDAVAEVQVLRNNYTAEYGNNGGAIITIVSKGGGQQYHGSTYYYLRNEALNGNNYFSNRLNLRRALYRHNIWGFNFGGPIWFPRFGEPEKYFWKDKAFFFFSYERPHTITPTDPVFVTVPTALERAGDFSQSRSTGGVVFIADPLRTGTCNSSDQTGCFRDPSRATASNPLGLNIIPLNRINSSGQALLNYYPLPNAAIAANPGQYIFQKSADTPKRSLVTRIDVKPTTKDSVYWKLQLWTADNEGLGTPGWPNGATGRDRWGILSHYLYKDNGWSANWVRVFSAKLVNEFSLGMRHDSEGFIPSAGVIEGLQRSALHYSAPQLFAANNRLGTIPRATGWTSILGNPANINWLDRWGEVGNDYIKPTVSDNLSVTHGDHLLKFGFYYERLLNSEAPGGQWSGVFDFGTSTTNGFTTAAGNTNFAYANALLGNFNSYTEASARPFTNLQLSLFQWYAADQWKMTKRFTLNYGMRFGWHSPFFQIDKQGSNFVASDYVFANRALLYFPYCNGQPNGIPPLGTACSAANQRVIDPRNPSVLLPARLVRSFVPGAGSQIDGLEVGTDPNTPKGYRTTRSIDYEPRIGFAWDIFGKGKTVIRAMGGVYHAPRVGGGTTGGNLVNNPPANQSFTLQNGNIDSLASLVGTQLNFISSINAVEVRSHTPETYNVSAGIQQNLGFNTIIEVSFVGSYSRWLGERRNINSVPDGAKFVNCPTLPAGVSCHPENRDPFTANSALSTDFLRPFPGFGDINLVTWSGTSNYNSLQVQLNRRYTSRFQYGVAYTFSKSLDYANDDSSDVNFGRPYRSFNYGVSDFDQPHILSVNYIYDVPGLSKFWNNGFAKAIFDNWQISGNTSWASGKPKSVSVSYTSGTATVSLGQPCPAGSLQTSTTSTTAVCTMITDFTGGQVNARPYLTCDPNKGATGSDPTGLPLVINVNCFAPPTALGQIGNVPRNVLRMPSVFNTDLSFFKNIPWGEKRNIRLRWEIYNLFNRTNFRDIDAALTYGIAQVNSSGGTCTATNICTAVIRQTRTSFGTPISARFPRVMQAAIQIDF
jgi:hypothetical protein